MNENERKRLQHLMDHNKDQYEDNTEGIRSSKHSTLIAIDIQKMTKLKKEKADLDNEAILSLCKKKCSFLYNSYMGIFNKVFKDELDLGLMSETLLYLKKIEDGEINQQEGSVMMGKLLHKIYVSDKTGNKIKETQDENTEDLITLNEGNQISWKEYKIAMKNKQ